MACTAHRAGELTALSALLVLAAGCASQPKILERAQQGCVIESAAELANRNALPSRYYWPTTTIGSAEWRAMRDRKMDSARTVVSYCVAASGQIEQVRIVRSSGMRRLDARTTSLLSQWRYCPYRAEPDAPPLCRATTFVYHARPR